MKRLDVQWADDAVVDLAAIVDFLAVRSPGNASRTLQKIRETAAKLVTLTQRGRIVPELAELGQRNYRELIQPPYRILYRATRRHVYVVAVLDARRDLEDVLVTRFGAR